MLLSLIPCLFILVEILFIGRKGEIVRRGIGPSGTIGRLVAKFGAALAAESGRRNLI
jgi:hypothetical protein